MDPVSILTIEDLLVARIKAQLTYLNKVDSYEGYAGPDALEELIVDAPAVLCSLERSIRDKANWECMQQLAVTHIFALSVVARDMRGPKDARRDLTGAYVILNDLREALHNYELSTDLSPLEFRGENYVTHTLSGVVYRAMYAVTEIEERNA